jgi:hypothetical protein
MPDDTTMINESNNDSPAANEKANETKSTSLPIEVAARRLERLLGGGGIAENDRTLDFYTNPVKVVRRWLGTSSGAAKGATLEDVKSAASKLLDPSGPCSLGRSLLLSGFSDNEDMVEKENNSIPSPLSSSSIREIESWLISLAVRLLWKEGRFAESFDLCQQGISIVMAHLEHASLNITSASAGSASSLFPLLARFYRLRSLVSESMTEETKSILGLQSEMARAHNMASVRRDVDSQATLLNCMLRDLLYHSQGRLSIVCNIFLFSFSHAFVVVS